jgi:hypothetical protein
MEEARGGDQEKPNKRKRIAEYVGSADFWTALATILLVIVGIVGVKITVRTLELSERAWLSSQGAQMLRTEPVPEICTG